MIYQELNEYDFVRAFDEMNRSENFSRPARVALYNWLDELADETGEPYSLDVIALCCEFTEYSEAELSEEFTSANAVYHYWVDLDERGEFSATVYKVAGDTLETVASVTGADFAEGGAFEGCDKNDPEDVVFQYTFDNYKPAPDLIVGADYGDETLENALEYFNDRTTVITVEHYNAPDSYIVGAF